MNVLGEKSKVHMYIAGSMNSGDEIVIYVAITHIRATNGTQHGTKRTCSR